MTNHDANLERSVLGSLLLRNSAIEEIDFLEAKDFYDSRHKVLFESIQRLHQLGKSFDLILVMSDLKERKELSAVGDCLDTITDNIASTQLIRSHAIRVKELSRDRQVREEIQRLATSKNIEAGLPKLQAIYDAARVDDEKINPAIEAIKPIDPKSLNAPVEPRIQLLTSSDGQDYLPKGKVGMLVAAGGAGKTQALVQLGVSVATGLDWLDTFKVVNPGRVALLLGEEDQQEIARRIKNIIGHERVGKDDDRKNELQQKVASNLYIAGLLGQDVSLIASDSRHDRSSVGAKTQYASSLIRRLNKMGPWELIVIDPLSRFAGPDSEKDNFIATRFIEACEELTTVEGNPTVIVASHNSKAERDKGSSTSPRGSSAFYDGARWVASMSSSEENETLKYEHTKSNYTARHKEVTLKRSSNGFLHVPTYDAPKGKTTSYNRTPEDY